MTCVVLDTEYTTWPGALESDWSGPGQHREIVQIAAVRVDGGFLETLGVDTVRHSSGDLHKLTDRPLEGQTHNALHDVRSMAHWLRHASLAGIFASLDQLPTGAPVSDPRSGARQVA